MDILICQSCGFILHSRQFICNGCGTFLSDYSPTSLPALAMANPTAPGTVSPDAGLLERVVTRQQVLPFTTAAPDLPPVVSERLPESPGPKLPTLHRAQPQQRAAGTGQQGATPVTGLSEQLPTSKPVSPLIKGDLETDRRTIRWTPATIALVLVGLAVVGLLGTAINTVVPKGSISQVPSLDGAWQVSYRVGQQDYSGEMTLHQNAAGQLTGEGQDTGYFVVNGSIDASHQPPLVRWQKQYIDDGQPKDNPISYSGEITTTNKGASMSGSYTTRRAKGSLLMVFVTARGTWHAEPLSQSKAGHDGFAAAFDAFTKITWFLLLVVIGLAVASVKLFGPNGVINIRAKNKYIPSQFETQHARCLRELGKPARPGGVPLGIREDWKLWQFHMPKTLALTPAMRDANPHMLLLGGGAKGKTRLLASMIAHDIEGNDRAVVILDSGGGLTNLITRWVTSHRNGSDLCKRIVVVDPTSATNCAAFNPLAEPEDGDLQASASAVVFGFKAMYTEAPGTQSQWSEQTANILRHSALLLMVNGKNLTDLPTLLSDNDFRDLLLEKVEKRKHEQAEFITLLETWGQYKRLARTDQWITWVEPILNRVSPMLSDPRIRPILTRAHGNLNLKEVIRQRKILLIKIPQGQLDQNANLLGSLIVTGLKRAALSLSSEGSVKHPCSLYLDEFDCFIEKETVRSFTKETTTFQIGLVGAMRTLQHLPEDLRSELIVNFATMCIFALAKKDGDLLGPQMFRVDGRKIKQVTLRNLINLVNPSIPYELISDEEKLNIDRVVGQEERTFFCYRVGTVAGVFRMRAPEFNDVPDEDVNWTLMNELRGSKPPAGRGQ